MKALCGLGKCCAKTRELDGWRTQQAQNHISFRDLVEQLQSKIFSLSYALLGNASEADTAAQKGLCPAVSYCCNCYYGA